MSGGDSHGGIVIVFTNSSRATCLLSGYPGAALVDAQGHQFVQATRTLTGYLAGCGCTTPTAVRVAPGATASSVLEGDNGGGEECLRGRTALVTPPNTRTSDSLRYLDAYSCHVEIHPVVAGTGGGTVH